LSDFFGQKILGKKIQVVAKGVLTMNYQGVLENLVGKKLLVGFTYYNEAQEFLYQKELYGEILSATVSHGIHINVPDGKNPLPGHEGLIIPPDLENILYAPRGRYTSQSTSEVVSNPDFLSAWLVFLPASDNEPLDMNINYAPLFSYYTPRHWKLELINDSSYTGELIRKYSQMLIGQSVLIGLTQYRQHANETELVRQEQLYGNISIIDREKGIVVEFQDGGTYTLPPDPTMLQPAAPGDYRLRSTGETIVDPRFITMWTINQEKTEPL